MIKLPDKLRDTLGTHGEIPVQNAKPLLFITGCMRSGTTFLVDKIASHPQLFKIGTELNEVWTKIGGASIKDRCEYKEASDASSYYTYKMTNYIRRFIEEGKTVKRHLMRLNEFVGKGKGRVFYDWENIIPVNKSPHLMNKIGYVRSVFPKSKFIIIVRDVFAHSASMKAHFDKHHAESKRYSVFVENSKECWAHYRGNEVPNSLKQFPVYPPDFSLIPKMWIRLNKLAINELKEVDEARFRIVSYEDLMLNQEEVFREIFKFINLKSKHSKFVRKVAKKRFTYKNTTTKGHPLLKWQRHLSDKEKHEVEEVIRDNRGDYNSILKFISEQKLASFC